MPPVLTILQCKLKEGKIAARRNRRIAALTQKRPPERTLLVNVARIPRKAAHFPAALTQKRPRAHPARQRGKDFNGH